MFVLVQACIGIQSKDCHSSSGHTKNVRGLLECTRHHLLVQLLRNAVWLQKEVTQEQWKQLQKMLLKAPKLLITTRTQSTPVKMEQHLFPLVCRLTCLFVFWWGVSIPLLTTSTNHQFYFFSTTSSKTGKQRNLNHWLHDKNLARYWWMNPSACSFECANEQSHIVEC